ncbi:MAG: hypothetical protein OXP66_16800, partial [Candidatus Tectomicrobia bacterium]|nr:hypothetical protein [Candidatus Tectomicrobia bacterium]
MMPELPGGPGGLRPPFPTGLFRSRRHRSRLCRRLLVLAAVGLAVAGCGYTLVGSQTSPSHDGTATVAVVPFTNTTHEPVVEHFMTAALRQALLQQRG